MRGLVMLKQEYQYEVLEHLFGLPVEVREAYMFAQVDLDKAYYLGATDKSGPELSIEANKRGIKAKYFGGHNNDRHPT